MENSAIFLALFSFFCFFKNHYNRNRFTSLLNNSSSQNPTLNKNSLLYYNTFNQNQKDALVWTGGGHTVNTPGGFVLINGTFDFMFQLNIN